MKLFLFHLISFQTAHIPNYIKPNSLAPNKVFFFSKVCVGDISVNKRLEQKYDTSDVKCEENKEKSR